MKINFQNDTINTFGENIPLISTTSGHYAILLTQAKQFMNNIDRGSTTTVNLMITKNKSNKAMALILHRQFSHPTPDKFINLITNAGISWSNNNELRKKCRNLRELFYMQNVQENTTKTCCGTTHCHSIPRNGNNRLKVLLWQNIVTSRCSFHSLSASIIILNKNPDAIIKDILRIWISVYRLAQICLTDNRREFTNNEFIYL